jgi:Na+-translocating ferredoxin:NAD+ oxidoreductase RnfD subunit
VGILVRSPSLLPFIVDSVASIASKYALTYKGRHLWNPSNFGISMMLFLHTHEASVLSLQWGNALWPLILIWAFGIFVLYQSGRLHVTATYVPFFLGFAWLRAMIQDIPFSTAAAPITGPMYQLFVFFMITDPKTSVQSKKGQCLVAALVAAAEFGFRLGEAIYAPLYALFLVGPAALIFERRKGTPPTGNS